jgi:hypothetical protein
MPNTPENSDAIRHEVTKPPVSDLPDTLAQPSTARATLTQVARVLGLRDSSFTVEELLDAAQDVKADADLLSTMDERHASDAPSGPCPVSRGVRNILDLPHDGKVKPVLDAVADLREGMVRVREALRLPEGISTDHVVDVLDSLWQESAEVRHVLSMPVDRFTAQEVSRRVEDLFGEANRIRDRLGRHPSATVAEVVNEIEYLQRKVEVRNEGLKGPQLVQDRPPTPHLNALRALLSTDEDASADWVLEVLLDRLRTNLGVGGVHVKSIPEAWRETLAGIEAATAPQREGAPGPGPDELALREALRVGDGPSVDEVIHLLGVRLARRMGMTVSTPTREVLDAAWRALAIPQKVAPVTLSEEAMSDLIARFEEAFRHPSYKVDVVPPLPEPMFSHAPESGLLYRVTMDSSGRRPFSLADVRNGVYLDRKITREQLLTRVCALVHPSEWGSVSRELTRAFDNEETTVHIRAELRNDLQGLMFPQVGSPKAQVTLELTEAPPDEASSPLPLGHLAAEVAQGVNSLCTLWVIDGEITQYVSPDHRVNSATLRFQLMTSPAEPGLVAVRSLLPTHAVHQVGPALWRGTLTEVADRLLNETGDFAISVPCDLSAPLLAAGQDARARRASQDPVVSGGTKFTPLYVTPRERTISREYPGTGARGTTWKVETEGDGTYYRVIKLINNPGGAEFFRFSGLSFVIEHLFSVPVFDPSQHYGVAVQSNIVDGLLNTLADLEGGR